MFEGTRLEGVEGAGLRTVRQHAIEGQSLALSEKIRQSQVTELLVRKSISDGAVTGHTPVRIDWVGTVV